MKWVEDGHIKYWWELSKTQKTIVIFISVVVWLGLWALLNLMTLGSVW